MTMTNSEIIDLLYLEHETLISQDLYNLILFLTHAYLVGLHPIHCLNPL